MSDSASLERWWMKPVEEELWNFSTVVAPKHVLAFIGFFVLMHSTVHTSCGAFMRRSSFSARDKLTAPRDVLNILHGCFSFCGGIVLTFLSSGEAFQEQERLFSYNAVHDLVATVNTGFWIYRLLLSVPNSSQLGQSDVLKTLGRTVVVAGLTYFHWFYPCVLSIKLWGWWSLGELAGVGASINSLTVLFGPPTSVVIASFMVALALTLVRFWGFSFLLLWAYKWVIGSELMELPGEHPVGELTTRYLTATCLGSLGMAYFAFMEFRGVLGATKEWSEEYKRAHSRARARLEEENEAEFDGNSKGGEAEGHEGGVKEKKNRGKRRQSKKSR
ncbi:hypothetical protein BSKO_11377 [Bryopsis sp. KO-2023]|nr:hypothetical protein BSKO_11377 [Bryopsis sp. KO-2023]